MAPIYFPIPLTGITFNSDSYTGGSVPAKFDAFLYKPTDRWSQLKLTIKLRINLRQSKSIPLVLDFDRNPFWTLPWSNADWAAFVGAAKAQADMWNNKFWLLPPASFSGFDEVYELDPSNTFPNKAFRPNIRCALDVDFAAMDDAHRPIDVANLNQGMLAAQGKPLNPGTFRSSAMLYDSLDTIPWFFPYGPGPGQPTVHFVIAHEIGHAMGLGHIGTILKTPLCQLAVAGENIFPSAGTPLSGGRNALVCYGFNQGLAIAGNIMGAGAEFTVDNASPWRWAALPKLIYKMVGGRPLSEYAQWRVVTRDPGPGSWIDNGLDVQEQEPVYVPVRITANDDSLIRISGDALFDFNKSNLKPEANVVLEQAAAAIKAKTGPRLRSILINGHTDDRGPADYNQRLSESRAKAVADWFFSRKYLKESNTLTHGFGKTQPRAPNTDAAGRAKNRRVEIYLVNS